MRLRTVRDTQFRWLYDQKVRERTLRDWGCFTFFHQDPEQWIRSNHSAYTSGGPAGDQAIEKFDKEASMQVARLVTNQMWMW